MEKYDVGATHLMLNLSSRQICSVGHGFFRAIDYASVKQRDDADNVLG
jgi:hypothetical protein